MRLIRRKSVVIALCCAGMGLILLFGSYMLSIAGLGIADPGQFKGIHWKLLSEGNYEIQGSSAPTLEELNLIVDGTQLTDLIERGDPYFLENNGGYFSFCNTAFSMSSDESFDSAPMIGLYGSSESEGEVIVEAHNFSIHGIDGMQLLDAMSKIATCDAYYREAPGWSYNRPEKRVIHNVDSGSMCQGEFQSLRILEQSEGGEVRYEYTYLISGDYMLFVYLATSGDINISTEDSICDIGMQYFTKAGN